MMKRILCGALAAAMIATVVPASVSDAASVPKAKYTFSLKKANKNVVAVARKGDDKSKFTCKTPNTGVLPKKAKIKLKYVKFKGRKCLYLDRKSSYGAELKGIKLGKGSWTVSFWVNLDTNMGDFMSMFFTGNNIVNPLKTKWVSLTKGGSDWPAGGAVPTIWSHNVIKGTKKGSGAKATYTITKEEFPWYGYQNEDGDWQGAGDTQDAVGVKPGKWTQVTLVVDTKDTCEYGGKGEDGYVKGYHGWTYINGQLFGNGAVAHNTMSNANKFFLGINAWDCPIKAKFSNVQLWNKALSLKQVAANYKKTK